MGLIVELERVIGVREVLIRLSFDLPVSFNPVKELSAFASVFRHRRLISFQRFVMPCFFGQRSLATVARNVFCKIVAASESCGIENRATNNHRNAGHFYRKIIFSIRKNLLVFKILFQSDAASHDSGEFGIIHNIAAGVVGEVFFHNFFSSPANAGGNAGESCGGHDCFHKLVVRHGILKKFIFSIHVASF